MKKAGKVSKNLLVPFYRPKAKTGQIRIINSTSGDILGQSLVKWPPKFVDLDSTETNDFSDFRGFTMGETTERRTEQRLRYYWPIWFAGDFNEVLSQGQMVDISSRCAAFTCHDDGSCPYLGQHITTRFSVPRYGQDDSFDMENFIRSGHISRIDEVNNYLRRVVIQFAEPLPFRPGEQAEGESETGAEKVLEPVEM